MWITSSRRGTRTWGGYYNGDAVHQRKREQLQSEEYKTALSKLGKTHAELSLAVSETGEQSERTKAAADANRRASEERAALDGLIGREELQGYKDARFYTYLRGGVMTVIGALLGVVGFGLTFIRLGPGVAPEDGQEAPNT